MSKDALGKRLEQLTHLSERIENLERIAFAQMTLTVQQDPRLREQAAVMMNQAIKKIMAWNGIKEPPMCEVCRGSGVSEILNEGKKSKCSFCGGTGSKQEATSGQAGEWPESL